MAFELIMVVVMEAFDGGVFDCSVPLPGNGLLANRERDAFDLTIGPWVLDLCQPMLDAVLFAAHAKHVRDKGSGRPTGVAWRESELDAIVGQDGVDFIGNGFDQRDKESRSGDPVGLFLQPDEGEFACPINRDKEMEFSFSSLNLCDIDVKVSDWVAFERSSGNRFTGSISYPPQSSELYRL
jgi:hypothetical protein